MRIGGNTAQATGSLRPTEAAIGSWLVYLRVHLNFRPSGSSTWSEVDYYETATSVPSGSPVGFTYATGPIVKTLEPRGNGDYQATLTSHGVCGGQDVPLTPRNPTPSGILTVLRPTITSNVVGMWWFGQIGKNDAANGYYNVAGITGTPNWSGTLTFTLVQGVDKARLSCTNCNYTLVQALAPSPRCTPDVEVRADLNGFFATSTWKVLVNRPAGRLPNAIYYNQPYGQGYWSKDYFAFTDIRGYTIPTVAYHERFPGTIRDRWPGGASAFWKTPPGSVSQNTGYRSPPSLTWDDIQAVCTVPGCVPTSVVPSGYTTSRSGISLLMQNAIVDLQQEWWVGDSGSGGAQSGILANVCRQTLFRDHAEDINPW